MIEFFRWIQIAVPEFLKDILSLHSQAILEVYGLGLGMHYLRPFVLDILKIHV